MEYRPTRKEIAYVAGMDDKKLENWLTRGIVNLVETKSLSRRWRRFYLADGIRCAVTHELTKYGVTAEMANTLVMEVFDFSVHDANTNEFHYRQAYRTQLEKIKNSDGSVSLWNKLKPLPDMSDDEASRFLVALSKYRWAIKCDITQTGPDLNVGYIPILLDKDESLPEDWQSFFVIKFEPIIDGAINRWKEIISKRTKENI